MVNNFPSHEADFPISELKEWDSMTFVDITDPHTHLRGEEYQNDGITPQASLQEARKWGTDTVWGMPNTKPRIIGLDSVKDYVAKMDEAGLGKQYVHLNMTDNKNHREEIEESIAHPNVLGIKIYPAGVTTAFDENEVKNLEVDGKNSTTLRLAAEICYHAGKTLTIHCETPHRTAEADGAYDFVNRVVLPLATDFPELPIVVAHENIITSADLVIDHNKKHKTNIWLELPAKYMLLSRDKHLFNPNTPHGNPFYKCQPRLRDSHNNMDLAALISRIDEEGVNILFATDHAPHPTYKKMGFVTQESFDDRLLESFGTTNFADITKDGFDSIKDHFTPELFAKAPGGIPDFRHSVEASLTAALQIAQDTDKYKNMNITYGQLQKFLSGNAMQVYTALQGHGNGTVASFTRWQHKPTEHFYNDKVFNVRTQENLQFKKTV